jgi:hypothetical protein
MPGSGFWLSAWHCGRWAPSARRSPPAPFPAGKADPACGDAEAAMVLFRVPGLISLAFVQDPGDVSSRPDQAISRLDRRWHVSAACSHGHQGSQCICTTTATGISTWPMPSLRHLGRTGRVLVKSAGSCGPGDFRGIQRLARRLSDLAGAAGASQCALSARSRLPLMAHRRRRTAAGYPKPRGHSYPDSARGGPARPGDRNDSFEPQLVRRGRPGWMVQRADHRAISAPHDHTRHPRSQSR